MSEIDEIVKVECSVVHDGPNVVNGRCHGARYRSMYTVKIASFDKEEARLLAQRVAFELNREVAETPEMCDRMYPRREA